MIYSFLKIKISVMSGSTLDLRQCGNSLALCYFAVVMELPDSLWMNCKSFKSNKLSLNTNKTFYMIFHRSRIKCDTDSTLDIIMDNSILRKTSSLKYLGVIVDQKLNWIEHISYVKK